VSSSSKFHGRDFLITGQSTYFWSRIPSAPNIALTTFEAGIICVIITLALFSWTSALLPSLLSALENWARKDRGECEVVFES
jgi:hypothetical protein